MEEWFFLDRIQLQRAHVSVRHKQLAPTIEPNAANAIQSLENHAAVTARITTDPPVFEGLIELSFGRECFEDGLKRG